MKLAVGEISLTPSAVIRALGGIAALLILASIAGQILRFGFGHDEVKGLVPLFNVDDEQNIPTYFSVVLMHVAALLLAGIAVSERSARSVHASKWMILAAGFVLMGYDEAFQIHEKLVGPMKRLLGSDGVHLFSYAWVIPGAALVFALLVYFRKFLLSLPAPSRRRFCIAAIVYLSGTIGMEVIGGRYDKAHGTNNLTYNALATVEESLEMAGMICFIWALLQHLTESVAEVRVRFRHVPPTPR